MVFRACRLFVTVAIFTMVTPCLATAAAAAHVLDHDHMSEQESDSLTAVLHGHRHSRGTPDHEHTLSPVTLGKASEKVASFSSVQTGWRGVGANGPREAAPRTPENRAFAVRGAGPPGSVPPPLRV